MGQIATTGLDIAKHIFQLHGVDATENVVIRRRLRRGEVLAFFAKLQPTLIGIEACGTSHHWARELSGMACNMKLMPPQNLKQYVKKQRNGMTDAAAIDAMLDSRSLNLTVVNS